MTRDEIIASNLSEVEKANERIKMLEDKLASIKQAIAELESQEPVAHWSDCAVHSEPAYPKGECNCGGFNPLAWLVEDVDGSHLYWTYKQPIGKEKWTPLFSSPPQRTEERNFCSRCGKRTADLTTIHTCTPPVAQPPQRTWVGLTEEERKQLWQDWENGHVVEAVEAKLKEKNNG